MNITPRKENFPDQDSNFEKSLPDKTLIEEGNDVIIWYEDYEDGTLVFVTVGNTTMNMPEETFYRLVKATQRAAKDMLGID